MTDIKKTEIDGVLLDDRKHLQFLREEIKKSSQLFENRRKKNAKNAVFIRFLALILSAFVTIILGLNLEPSKLWNGIALTLSALTGVVSGFSSFFDFNALAIKYKDTEDQLNMLRIKIEYLDLQQQEISMDKIDELRDEYLITLSETYEFFQSIKKEDSQEKKGKRFEEAKHS